MDIAGIGSIAVTGSTQMFSNSGSGIGIGDNATGLALLPVSVQFVQPRDELWPTVQRESWRRSSQRHIQDGPIMSITRCGILFKGTAVSPSGYRDNPDGLGCTAAVCPFDLETYIHVIRLGRVRDVAIAKFLLIDGHLFGHGALRDCYNRFFRRENLG
jgi:hypothetical protein